MAYTGPINGGDTDGLVNHLVSLEQSNELGPIVPLGSQIRSVVSGQADSIGLKDAGRRCRYWTIGSGDHLRHRLEARVHQPLYDTRPSLTRAQAIASSQCLRRLGL